MAELQQNRYDQLIRRVGGIIESGSMVSETISELFPMIDVERVPGELLFLNGTRLGIGSVFQTQVAGQVAIGQLFNPADSGMIVTLSTCIITTTSTQRLEWEVGNVAFGSSLGNNILRDTRSGPAVITVAEVRGANQVATLTGHGQIRVVGDRPLTLNDQNAVAVLFPGSGFAVGCTLVNTDIEVNFFWRERVFERSEGAF